jgi:hypothetical protein
MHVVISQLVKAVKVSCAIDPRVRAHHKQISFQSTYALQRYGNEMNDNLITDILNRVLTTLTADTLFRTSPNLDILLGEADNPYPSQLTVSPHRSVKAKEMLTAALGVSLKHLTFPSQPIASQTHILDTWHKWGNDDKDTGEDILYWSGA